MAKKRRTVRRRRPGTRGSKLSASTRRKISLGVKRAQRAKKRNPSRKRAAPKRKRTTRRRRKNPTTPRFGKSGRFLGVSYKRRKTSKKTRRYAVPMTRKRKLKPRIKRIGKKNPMGMLKRTLPIYGGFLAVRVLHGLFRHYVNPMLKLDPDTERKFGPLIPAGALFLASMFAPKIIKGKPKIVEGIQLGATFSLLNTIVRQFVAPSLPDTGVMATVKGALSGYDDVGVMGYGYGSYVADPSLYELPAPSPTAAIGPGVGLDVTEAMALDEYIAEPLGFDVQEALAGTEVDYMQRGGAGGSLAKTVFTD